MKKAFIKLEEVLMFRGCCCLPLTAAFYEEAEQIAPVVVFAAQVGQAVSLTMVVLVAEEVAKITVNR